ncbi:ras guanine nucleotide exchange factor domain-containing protein [Paraphysoderma sedebokerense]|nr:ras guanine nucleotide exchange factor domain-containing protein [Paraphysoderma sedebokerense]
MSEHSYAPSVASTENSIPTPDHIDVVVGLHTYAPSEKTCISFSRGDIIFVYNMDTSGWWDGVCNGKRGWFPSNYVKSIMGENGHVDPRKLSEFQRQFSAAGNDMKGSQELSSTPLSKQNQQMDEFSIDNIAAMVKEATLQPSKHEQLQGTNVLPPYWRQKRTPEGQVYYYNTQTNETAWNIDATGRPDNTLESDDKGTPGRSRAPSNAPSLNDAVSNDGNPTWDVLINNILRVISDLNKFAKRDDKPKYVPQVNTIVRAIRDMLISSDTISKTSHILKTNVTLRSHHHHLLSALAKLVLAAKVASGIWPPPDAVNKMRYQAGQVLLAIRHFVSIAQDVQIKLKPIPPSATVEEEFDMKGAQLTDVELVAKLDSYSHTIVSGIASIVSKISAEKMASAGLIDLTRETVNQVGQLLSLIEDIRVPDQAEAGIKKLLSDFQAKKELLYSNINDLVTAGRTVMDQFAPPNALQILMSSSTLVLRSVEDLVVTTKLLVEQKEYVEQLLLQDELDELDKRRRDSELSILQRRAMSLTFLPDSGLSPNTSPVSPLQQNFPHSPNDLDSSGGSFNMSMGSIQRHPSTGGSMNSLHPPPQILGPQHPESPLRHQASIKSLNPIMHVENFNRSGSSQSLNNPHPTIPGGLKGTVSSAGAFSKAAKQMFRKTFDNGMSAASLDSTKVSKFFGENVENVIQKQPQDIKQSFKFLGYDYKQGEITFNMEGQVSGGTIDALIERLTIHDVTPDSAFTAAFFLTFRCFTTPAVLCDLLIKRFTMQPSPELSDEEIGLWVEKKLHPVRLRVFNVFKTWLELYYIDIEDDGILDTIQDFASRIMSTVMPQPANRLCDLVKKRATVIETPSSPKLGKAKSTEKLSECPPPIIPKDIKNNIKNLNVLDLDPMELARQLTIMEMKLFVAIKPRELMNQCFSTKKDKTGNAAPNVKAMSTMSTQISGWVAESILSESDAKKRATIVKQWVKVGDRCLQMKNYNTLMAIISALNSSTIARLKRTWELITAKTNETFATLKQATDHSRNFAEYRATLKAAVPPCLPFLGLYLTDLTFIDDGNPSHRGPHNSLINFDKHFKTAKVIIEIQRFQSSYKLIEVPEIQQWLNDQITSCKYANNPDELYRMSLQLEPKESSNAGAPPPFPLFAAKPNSNPNAI